MQSMQQVYTKVIQRWYNHEQSYGFDNADQIVKMPFISLKKMSIFHLAPSTRLYESRCISNAVKLEKI